MVPVLPCLRSGFCFLLYPFNYLGSGLWCLNLDGLVGLGSSFSYLTHIELALSLTPATVKRPDATWLVLSPLILRVE